MAKRIGNGLWIYEQGEDFLVVTGYCPNEVYDKSEADMVISYNKYKRCLAMAKWCLFWANYWHCCEPTDLGVFIARERFFRKWQKRWLKIAEQFKETK